MQDTKVSEKVFRYFGILQGMILNYVRPIFFQIWLIRKTPKVNLTKHKMASGFN